MASKQVAILTEIDYLASMTRLYQHKFEDIYTTLEMKYEKDGSFDENLVDQALFYKLKLRLMLEEFDSSIRSLID